VDGRPRSNPRDGNAAVLVALFACACRSVTERELALSVAAQALPGAGASAALSQVLVEHGERRLAFELGLERQELDEEGPRGDDWTRVWAGLRSDPGGERGGFDGHAGVTWLRSEGPPTGLSEPGDYGGAYLGAGWVFPVAPALATGPDVTLLYVDAEGDRSGSGAVLELAWRLIWWL
jgi:hypothetical protein